MELCIAIGSDRVNWNQPLPAGSPSIFAVKVALIQYCPLVK